MTPQEVINELAKMLDDSTFKKGFMNIIDGPIYKAVISGGYDVLNDAYPEIAQQLVELGQEFIEKDKAGMIDEAADVLAEIVKTIYLNNKRL